MLQFLIKLWFYTESNLHKVFHRVHCIAIDKYEQELNSLKGKTGVTPFNYNHFLRSSPIKY